MNNAVKEATSLLEILPESEQDFALEFIRKLVLAWDVDYTKLTAAERARLEEAKKDMKENGTVPHEEIDW